MIQTMMGEELKPEENFNDDLQNLEKEVEETVLLGASIEGKTRPVKLK